MAPNDIIAPFEATEVDAIPKICAAVRQTFRTNKTKNVEWRKVQLRKFYWAVVDYFPKLMAALKQDLNKSEYESTLSELDWVREDCLFMIKHLDKFSKDEPLGSPHVPLTFAMTKTRIHKEPLGSVLIIGPYNYPLMLVLCPAIAAIAAGCTVVIKPSEGAPACSAVLKEMIQDRLDPGVITVVNGFVPEITALLDEKWDKIFYTGNGMVARIIAKKAAETLTPVTLELGGCNPAFVTKNSDLHLAARRLLWSKCLNAGQVCLSLNYILVDKAVVQPFIEELKKTFNEFFPNGAKDSELAHIINERHFLRIKKMLDESKGKIVMGGQMDQSQLFMEPTAVLVESMDDSMVTDEVFGPIFAVLPCNGLQDAINIANRVDRTPLALFSFGSKAENNKVLNEMTSGGATFNDCFQHAQLNTVAFGGVGESGTGSTRGKAGFDTFTHFRTVAEVPGWMEPFYRVRYMPYKIAELRRLHMLTLGKPDFDRNGKVIKGFGYWASLLFGLGGKSAKGAFVRWLLVLASAYVYTYGLTLQRSS